MTTLNPNEQPKEDNKIKPVEVNPVVETTPAIDILMKTKERIAKTGGGTLNFSRDPDKNTQTPAVNNQSVVDLSTTNNTETDE